MAAAFAWLNMKPAPDAAEQQLHFQQCLDRLKVAKRADGSKVARIRVEFKDKQVQNEHGGWVKVHTLVMDVTDAIVQEAIAILLAYAE
eukprot:11328019-Karenia_brevis.AAC.1